ncbi:uncharacterized protein LOC121834732 [Ixodes scapularis]|uniref:uncharacterized protein LOC121834732 n=1 Tax=Ixodes scapularis TaxID=6945 RepID=UPI001C38E53E|nr:uncharacterized protein LOC121834732 [Ixodes scapularis]
MAYKPCFFVPQVLLPLLAYCASRYNGFAFDFITMDSLPQVPVGDSRRHDDVKQATWIYDSPRFIKENPSTSTTPAAPDVKGWQFSEFSSGHGSSATAAMAYKPCFFVPQVGIHIPLNLKNKNKRLLLLFPSPRVFLSVILEYLKNCLLLLMSGDVESNPGPFTRTTSSQSTKGKTSQPMVSMTEDNTEGAVALTQAEQNIEILRMLRDLQKQSAEIATGNQELKQSITEIRNGQQNIESTLTNIGGRLTAVEEKLEVLDSVEVDLRNTSNTVEGLQRQNQLLQTRINELEDSLYAGSRAFVTKDKNEME